MKEAKIIPLGRDELPDYIEIGRRFFPDAHWAGAPERLGAMMALWNQGILVSRDQAGKIVAYYTLWPITSEAYEAFLDGTLKDADMNASRMPSSNLDQSHYWIMTAIAVEPAERDLRRAIILAMLGDMQTRLVKQVPSTVIAHAATVAGERFLARTGFKNPNPAEPKVYILEIQ